MNLFVPSSLTWKNLKVTQQTLFPKDNKTTVSFEGSNTETFVFGFRKPEWLSGSASVKVNGQSVVPVEKDGWLTIERVWNGGDNIEIELPMAFEVCKMPDGKNYPAALKYGPLAMAVQNADEYPTDILTKTKTPKAGEPMTFTVEGHENWVVRPYYTIGKDDLYFVYVDPSSGFVVPDKNITRNANGSEWGNFVTWHCDNPGAYVEVRFEGTGIQWNAIKYDDSGKVRITIDGEDIETVDLYSANRDVAYSWDKRNMHYGEHVLRLTLLEEKNPASKGTWINYVDFVVFNEELPIVYRFGNGNAWGLSDNYHNNKAGSYIEVLFEGTGLGWNGYRFDDAGISTITLDGNEIGTADQYGPVREAPFYWEIRDLAQGQHTLRITNSGQKNPASKGTWINYIDFTFFSETSIKDNKAEDNIYIKNGKVYFPAAYMGRTMQISLYDFSGRMINRYPVTVSYPEILLPKQDQAYIIRILNDKSEQVCVSKLLY
jgi:hypothetical protein